MAQDPEPLPLNAPALAPIWVIFGLCVFAEALLVMGDLDWIGPARMRSWVYENGAFWPGLWRDWRANYGLQPYVMLISYAFLHGSLLHLGLNMVTLVSLGRGVIQRVGGPRFLAIYASSALGGAVAYAMLSASGAPMVGASGALFGLAGAVVAWMWEDGPTLTESMMDVGRVVALLVAINVVMYWGLHGRLAWETHLGGFVAGWIAGYVFDRRAP